MNEKQTKRIDQLLGELGLYPTHLDPEKLSGTAAPFIPASHNPETGPCGKTCYLNEATARKRGKRIMERGTNTSFLRPYLPNRSTPRHQSASDPFPKQAHRRDGATSSCHCDGKTAHEATSSGLRQ
jgi:hypothetical protein